MGLQHTDKWNNKQIAFSQNCLEKSRRTFIVTGTLILSLKPLPLTLERSFGFFSSCSLRESNPKPLTPPEASLRSSDLSYHIVKSSSRTKFQILNHSAIVSLRSHYCIQPQGKHFFFFAKIYLRQVYQPCLVNKQPNNRNILVRGQSHHSISIYLWNSDREWEQVFISGKGNYLLLHWFSFPHPSLGRLPRLRTVGSRGPQNNRL